MTTILPGAIGLVNSLAASTTAPIRTELLVGDRARTALTSGSLTYTLPAESSATATGRERLAVLAGPPSPEKPLRPPATLVMIPSGETLQTLEVSPSAMNRLPLPSTVT